MQKTVLITGANRGLGLEFARQYAAAGWRVIATCRTPAAAIELNALASRYPCMQIEALDVTNCAQIDELAARLADEAIDLLLNNAGVYGDESGRELGNLDYENWAATLAVNTIAPLKMAEAFLPQLERSHNLKLIASVSSLMGSITDNSSGGSYLYRSSKAGLNAAMKSLALDLRDRSIGVLVLHPGWVKTDMGGKNALIEVDESVRGMRRVLDNFSLEQSGSFIRYDGRVAPW